MAPSPRRSPRLAAQNVPADGIALKMKKVRKVRREERYYEEHKYAIWTIAAGIVIFGCAIVAALFNFTAYAIAETQF